MFEENNNIEQDIIFRSILEEGTEDVPVHVWERIEDDLDRIAQRRKVVLWFRRTAAGVAAAAALALGLFIDWGAGEDFVSPASHEGMIAVVEKQQNTDAQDMPDVKEIKEAAGLVAMADRPAKTGDIQENIEEQADSEQHAIEKEPQESEIKESSKPRSSYKEKHEWQPETWPAEEPARKRRKASLVVSGITGTNSTQNSNRVNPMKRPGISAAPQQTGIKETSTNTTYGIPVSAGVGVRIDLAPRWSIGTGVNYTLLTRKFFGTYTEVGTNGSILKDISSDIKNNQHYVGIPVNVYYDIVSRDRVNFYAYAGGAVEKCVSDKYHLMSTDIIHTEKVKGVQFSADLGMGVEFLLGKSLGLYLDPSLRYYFNNSQPKSIRTAQPLMFGFEMGFRFRL